MCSCDGPPHTYDPVWCGAGRRARVEPPTIAPARSAAAPIRAAARSDATIADAEAWVEKLEDDAHWARDAVERAEKRQQARLLRELINRARGA